MKYDILIIGAGASGLMAMSRLLESGYSVCMLEANGQAGGRISTLNKSFTIPVNEGAEFIHGTLPLTLKLLREAEIGFRELSGKMIGVTAGEWSMREHHDQDWDLLLQKLKEQETDTTLELFLEEHFHEDKFNDLTLAARRFAEGFDLADPIKLSVLSIKKEWLQEEQTQYRIQGGYGQLIDYIHSKCIMPGGKIVFNTSVTKIEYGKSAVTLYSSQGKVAEGSKVIVTASVGILQKKFIRFAPVPVSHMEAINQLGFGSVIKIILEFTHPFWMDKSDDIGFLLSDQRVPTWWTQLPLENNILTGWIGGPQAFATWETGGEVLLHEALISLSNIFSIPIPQLSKMLLKHQIAYWTPEHPYTAGGYSYSTIYSEAAIEILNTPVLNTIYFAGEALCTGTSRGTVEAALESGQYIADMIIAEEDKK